MNLKIAICDDMEFYVQNTKKAILAAQRQEDTYEIHEFMSGKALVDYIRKEQGTFDVNISGYRYARDEWYRGCKNYKKRK